MKRILISLLLLTSVSSNVFADWDPELEAAEAAENAAAKRQAEVQRQQAEQMKQQALARMQAERIADLRESLGAEALGKSDAEVERLNQARVQKSVKDAATTVADAQRAMAKAEKIKPQKVDMNELDANTKAATGKSFADLSKMSDAELEALAAKMEQEHGE